MTANDSPDAPFAQSVHRDPERTQASILAAATQEFAENGFGGARVDAIARRAGTNKRMLYHYFGDKEALYLVVLEDAYAQIRNAEATLDLTQRSPESGLRELALFTWRYFVNHPEFLSLLGTENLHRARYLKQSTRIRTMHTHLMTELSAVLARGQREGVFAEGIDPINTYLTMAAMAVFYLSNRHTLSVIFGRDLSAPEHMGEWEKHVVHVALASVRK